MSVSARDELLVRAGLDELRAEVTEDDARGLLAMLGPEVSIRATRVLIYTWLIETPPTSKLATAFAVRRKC